VLVNWTNYFTILLFFLKPSMASRKRKKKIALDGPSHLTNQASMQWACLNIPSKKKMSLNINKYS